MRLLTILLFTSAVLLGIKAEAQQRNLCNLELQSLLSRSEPGDIIPVYLRGSVVEISTFVRNSSGTVKSTFGNVVSCNLPARAFDKLSEQPFIQYVEYSHSPPQMLNDVMITNNNIHPVHQGVAPLNDAYTGADVIVGFIDSGIELDHPDFQNPDGSTRLIALWDQTQDETVPFRIPQPYGYGQVWNSEDIDAGISNHSDQAQFSGHGSNVAGIGVGNANATGDFLGVAPDADIIVVSSDFSRPNWKSTVAEAVDYIFTRAAEIGKPAVVNASLGTYFGSHDALDAPALYIDSLLQAAPGRAMVAAAGNSDQFPPYHLSYNVPETDTAFTWFSFNANSSLGYGAVFFELWADVDDFENVQFTMGADLTVPSYEFRGYAGWRTAAENLNTLITDTIFFEGAILAIVDSWCGQRGDQYQIQVVLRQPFSAQYNWRFATTGGGTFDCWSYASAGTSAILATALPSASTYPEMAKYRLPDKQKTIVDSWACSESVITVGNYVNRDNFQNILGTVSTFPHAPGSISVNTSRGPTRDNRQKPDIAASGDVTVAAGRLATLNALINSNPQKVSISGMHYSNGGTSMASPVVAGVAALYFSRCPLASFADFKQALTENGLADGFTGPLPGYQMGHGKLDAWATLSSTIEPLGVSVLAADFCEGSSVSISADGGYTNYTWSNGFEGNEIAIEIPGTYFAEATDEKGCAQRSAPITIIELQAPQQPDIILENEVLLAVGEAVSWQWYVDGSPIDGAVQNSFVPSDLGVYTVEAIGANGCGALSGPYFFGVVGTEEYGAEGILIYPNPAQELVWIDAGDAAVKTLRLYDVAGRYISGLEYQGASGHLVEMDIKDVSSGVYIVHIQLDNGVHRFMKLAVEN